MNETNAQSRPARVNLACQNCRKKKKKCDRNIPCTPCIQRRLECVFSQEPTSNFTSRSRLGSVQDLETEIAMLESEASRLQGHDTPITNNDAPLLDTPTPENSESALGHPLLNNPGVVDLNVLKELETVTLYHGETYSVQQMVRRVLHLKNTDPIGRMNLSQQKSLISLIGPKSSRSSFNTELLQTSSALPYVDQYFSCVHSTFPFLSESDIRCTLGSISNKAQAPGRLIILYLILAIGAVFPSSTSFFDTANSAEYFLRASEVEFSYGETLETAQILLLFTIYSLLDSSAGNSWHLVDLAMQACILLGLHQSQLPGEGNTLKEEDLTQREQTFWTAYILDRCISSSLGLPMNIADNYITLQLPSIHSHVGEHLGFLCSWASSISQDSPENAPTISTLDALSDFNSRILRYNSQVLDPTITLPSIVGFQLSVLTLRYTGSHLINRTRTEIERLILENHLEHLELQTISSCTVPWIAGYSIFQAAILHILSYYNENREQIDTSRTDLTRTLRRIHASLTTLSSKYKGLSDYANLIQSIQSTFERATPMDRVDFTFLARTDLYGFCKSAVDLMNSTMSSSPMTNF
ncbi:fungal-specific transcription factor domain-containing protein [Xylogone sp. PMI_703]|nr:fungal-specific transcription factor domain-containing protein [Xylogone sp. PMI_703]